VQFFFVNYQTELYEKQDKLPSAEDLLAIIQMSPDDLAKKENAEQKEIFLWYFDRYLEVAAGKLFFGSDVKYYALPTDKRLILGVEKPHVTVTSESFGFLMYESCVKKWIKIFDYKKLHGKDAMIPKAKDDGAKEYAAKWSDANSGQIAFGGWSDEAYTQFEAYKTVFIQLRKDDEANGKAIQKYAKKLMREKKGITAESLAEKKKRKRKKAVLDLQQPKKTKVLTVLEE